MTTNHPEPDPAGQPQHQTPAEPYGPPYTHPYAAPYGQPYTEPYAAPYGQPYYPPAYVDPAYAQGYPGPAYGEPGYWAPPAPTAAPRRKPWRLAAGVATLTVAALVGVIAIGDAVSGDSTAVAGSGANGGSSDGGGSGSGGQIVIPGGGTGNGSGGTTQLPGGGGTSTSVTLANDKQKVGIVTIVSTLRYQNSQSAGTGMVLTGSGEILTNNHVVNGATSIVVTVVSTGKSYRADVVGTAPTKDVAVLRLRNASGLKTAKLAGAGNGVKTGDSVIGVGNAGGTGTLRASSGKVTALGKSITASDEGSGADAERLTGLIEVNAPIISGDSGGPLYDSSGKVVGMDTAASANTAQAQAYAIPIANAVKVAGQIESGHETSTIHIGLPPFLGVSIASDSTASGAAVESLLDGGPAAAAGVTAGSVITKVGGTTISTGSALKTALQKYQPGQKVTITWTDAAGASHSATVTLATGPAD